MGVTILANPPVIWDYYTAGPFIRNIDLGNQFSPGLESFLQPGYSPDRFSIATPRQVWTADTGGTGIIKDKIRHRGTLALRVSTTSVLALTSMGGIQIVPNVDRTGLGAGYRNPSWRRVNWLTFNVAQDPGVLGTSDGFMMAITATIVDGASRLWPAFPGTAWGGGFGVVCDGAGGWQFENYAGGPFPAATLETVALSTIADPEDFNTLDFVWVGCDATRPARFELHVNGVLFLQRNWETAVAPATILTPTTTFQYRWTPIWQMATASGDRIMMADWVYRMGRFLPDGRELFS